MDLEVEDQVVEEAQEAGKKIVNCRKTDYYQVMNKVFTAFKSLYRKTDNELYNLIRDLFLTTFIGGLASVLNYVFNFLAANRLPEDSFSTFSGILGIIYLVQIPAFSIQTYFTDLLSKDPGFFRKNNFDDILRRFFRVTLLLVLFSLAISPLLSMYMKIETGFLMLSALSIFGFIYSPMMKGILLGLNKIDQYNFVHLSETILKLVIFLIALNFTTDPTWPIIAFGIPSIILGLIVHVSLVTKGELRDSVKLEHRKIELKTKYFLVTILTFLFYNAAFSIDVILIDPANRASYASLSLLGKIVYFASVMTASVLFSYFSRRGSRKERERYLWIGIAMNLAVSLAIVIVYIFFGELIVTSMFGGRYSEILPLVVPLSLGMVFYSTAFTFVNYFLARHKIFQIILLGVSIVGQVILYQLSNSNLHDAVRNQVITYIGMFGLMASYWFLVREKKK